MITLESITFNHHPECATRDAFNIRKNEKEFVTLPEWRQGTPFDQQSPAAYAIKAIGKNVITIRAKFTCQDPTIKELEVQAINFSPDDSSFGIGPQQPKFQSSVLPPRLGHSDLLGRVPAQLISFSQDGELLNLEGSKVATAGVGVHVIHWEWQYRQHEKASWTTFAKTSHRIYTVLRVPKRPWLQHPYTPDNTQLPWTEVLDFACDWAKESKDPDQAAAKVTKSFRDVEKVFFISYDLSAFYSGLNFDCTAFLDLIRGGIGIGNKLNCSDCATVVSTFANILGCSLWQSTMDGTYGMTFPTNPIRLFGRTCWRPSNFGSHEVAWKGRCTECESFFDATLELDGDDFPTHPPQKPLLPRNIKLGGRRDRQYLFRFLSASYPGTLEPNPKSRCHRAISPKTGPIPTRVTAKHLALLKSYYRFDEWPPGRPATKLSTVNDLRTKLFAAKHIFDWNIVRDPTFIEAASGPLTIQMILESENAHLRLDIDVCGSNEAARNHLLQRLGQFDSPTLQRSESSNIGEISFVEPEVGAILFLRKNLIALVRNAGNMWVDSKAFARELDLLL